MQFFCHGLCVERKPKNTSSTVPSMAGNDDITEWSHDFRKIPGLFTKIKSLIFGQQETS